MSQRPNIEELLCDYLDGTLDAVHQRQLETLLKRHAKLRKVLAQMQQARGMLRELPVEKMPTDAAAELQARLREAEPGVMRLYSRPWLMRLAAAVALAVTGGLVIWAVLPSSSPRAEQAVAFESAAARPAPTEMLAQKDSAGAAKMAEADADAEGENESAVMVVMADDIRGTQREIRDLLTSNNISYESVNPPAEVRQETTKEGQEQVMGRPAQDTVVAAPAPAGRLAGMGGPSAAAPAAAPAPMAKAETETATPATPPAAQAPLAVGERLAAPSAAGEAKSKVLADEARQEQVAGGAAAPPATPATPQAIARAVESARQVVGPMQEKSQAGGAQAPGGVYGVVVARNVTSDQLGKIRSGLRDASRSRNLRVVDAPVDRRSQMGFSRDQTANRADAQYPYQQTQVQMQDRQQVAAAEPQRRISYSVRYDVTIVVQGETAAGAAATQANIPTWPLPATRPSGTLPATGPVGR